MARNSPDNTDQMISHRNAEDFNGARTGLVWSKLRRGLTLKREAGKVLTRGEYVSPWVPLQFRTSEFLPSWNLDLDERSDGYRIYLRYKDGHGLASPWFYLGSGGILIPRSSKTFKKASPRWGQVKVDYLSVTKPATAIQYRIQLATRSKAANDPPPALVRFFICASAPLDSAIETPATTRKTLKSSGVHVPVPYRSQRKVSDKALRNLICCPTCVSMMLEHLGVDKPTLDVCALAYDKENDIYGVWPRASQTASLHGLESWVGRFRFHHQIHATLNAGQPIMASIRVQPGQLRGARYKKSRGHLILIIGYRPNGDYIVNDPFSEGRGGAEIDYCADDIEQVWLRNGGVGIIIRKPTD